MKDEYLGIPVQRGVELFQTDHQANSIEITEAHKLMGGIATDYDKLSRTSYVTVRSYDERGNLRSFHQVPQLPTALGRKVTEIASSGVAWMMSWRV